MALPWPKRSGAAARKTQRHHPVGELLLFAASRAELVQQVIQPALENDSDVILDRFFDSTTAYQGYGRGLDLDMLAEINRIASCRPCRMSPSISTHPGRRAHEKVFRKSLPLAFESEELDRMENSGLDFYRRVREGYHKIGGENPNRIIIIDALLSPSEIHRKIISSIDALCTKPHKRALRNRKQL